MKRFLILAALLFLADECFSQASFYPMTVGDSWVYVAGPEKPDTLTVTIEADTVIAGRVYMKRSGVSTLYGAAPTLYERQDSTGDVYRIFPPESTEILLYRLSDTTSSWWHPVESLNRFDSSVVREIFGRPRKVLYVGGYMPPDTSLLQQRLLVDSIGYYTMLYNGYIVGNLPGRLVEAWVGGVHYGSVAAIGRRPEALPAEPVLMQNYPNPFNPSTTIRYALPHGTHIRLTVFNVLGQEVATFVDGEVEAGYHEVTLDAAGLASGVYFYRLQAAAHTQTRTMCLIR